MKIDDIRVSAHLFRTSLPVMGGQGPSEARVICRVSTDDGHVGVGMTARFLPAAVAAAIRHHLAPAIVGLDPLRIEAIRARLLPLVSERGVANGVNRAALSCIDLALWDIAGQHAGRSVSSLLGGHRESADAYVTFGFLSLDRDDLAVMAQGLAAEGHSRFKMVVGHPGGLAEDARRFDAVADALGAGAMVAIDANEGLRIDDAIRLTRMIGPERIAWFEDPVFANDAQDLARLRAVTGVAVSAGQMDGDARRFRSFAEHDALDIWMPNSMYNGGISETMRVAHMAETQERALSDAGGGGVFCLHHMTAFRCATLAEHHVGTAQIEAAMFGRAARIEAGVAHLPGGVGWGVALDESALRETLIPEY